MRDVTTPEVHDVLVRRICAKIAENREKIVRTEYDPDPGGNARVGVISYGATSRPARGAVLQARRDGTPVDFLRLITIWPFARTQVAAFGKDLDIILVPEMNLGQISREIERFVTCPVKTVAKIGGIPPTIDEIYQVIREVA
jgi:2-oxoglutarate ferredoxin oxidoreductase subunit alpha